MGLAHLRVPERALGTLRESYRTINHALLAGVRGLGVPAVLQPSAGGGGPPPSTTPCFQDPTEGEVVVDGRKLIGSAQYRQRGVLLQHGSLLLADDQALLAGLSPGGESDAPEFPPAVLEEHCKPLPAWSELIDALAEGWRRELSTPLCAEEPLPEEIDLALRLQLAHSEVEWIWRR